MNPALDDLDARPGSTTSLVRTIVGLYIRELGGWISSTHLIALMDALGHQRPGHPDCHHAAQEEGDP